MSYNEKIRNNILTKGNTYGVDINIIDDGKTHKIILHQGCTARFRENELIDSVVNCLDKKNIKYDVLSDETCCGIMLFLLGDIETGKDLVNENIKKFNKHGVKKIITICPGCYESFKDYYSKNPDFNIEVIFALDLFNNMEFDGTGYVVHDPCHALERKEQARSIIKNVPNTRVNSCCGFGVSIKTGNKEDKIRFAQKTLSKGKVITYCPACYHTLNTVDSSKTIDIFTLINEQL